MKEFEPSVWRKGQSIKVPIKTGEMPNEIVSIKMRCRFSRRRRRVQNVVGEGRLGSTRRRTLFFPSPPVRQGVRVTDVEDNSIAVVTYIQREDVITEVDGKPVANVQSFRGAAEDNASETGRPTYKPAISSSPAAHHYQRSFSAIRQIPLAIGGKNNSLWVIRPSCASFLCMLLR